MVADGAMFWGDHYNLWNHGSETMTNYLYEVRKSRCNHFFKYYITRVDENDRHGTPETLEVGLLGSSWWYANRIWDMDRTSYYLTEKGAEKALLRYLHRIDAILKRKEAIDPRYDERLIQIKIAGQKILIDKSRDPYI